jgi:hypothetical protein
MITIVTYFNRVSCFLKSSQKVQRKEGRKEERKQGKEGKEKEGRGREERRQEDNTVIVFYIIIHCEQF